MPFKDLVVVTTHNGSNYLPQCLESLGDNYPILVVDAGSNDVDFKNSLGLLDCIVAYTEKTYQPGVWLHAYKNYPSENYLFIQDSMKALVKDYIEPFRGSEATAWATFPMDSPPHTPEQLLTIKQRYPYHKAQRAIFGPIFYASKKALDKLSDQNLWPGLPGNKEGDSATERYLAMAFDLAGVKVSSLNDFDLEKAARGELSIFIKEFGHRD
jgi:hypothetical protein